MKNSKFDVWAIQHYPQEMATALEGVKSSPRNTLFTNCTSYLRVGDRVLHVHFDRALYCEESQRLILLMQNAQLSTDEFRKMLDERGIEFQEVRFIKTKGMKNEKTRELWFAQTPEVLEDALKESKAKGIDTCDYYPEIRGVLELRYLCPDNFKMITFDSQLIRGVEVLDDKIVLNLKQGGKKQVEYHDVLKLLQQYDYAPSIRKGVYNLPKSALPKQYKKEQ